VEWTSGQEIIGAGHGPTLRAAIDNVRAVGYDAIKRVDREVRVVRRDN
jgi:hypothetical protein